MLTRDTFIGPWAGLPVAWTDDDRFDETAYRADVARCCQAGVPGVYSGGTTGEFYAMEFDEFKAVTRAIVEESHAQGKPAMTGCTSTYTLGAVRRAAYAAEVGADAIQVTLPYWMEIGDRQIVPFFQEVVKASGGLPLSIYETMRAKKGAPSRTTPCDQGCGTQLLGGQGQWRDPGMHTRRLPGPLGVHQCVCWRGQFRQIGPGRHKGGCSSLVYWNPRVILPLWQQVEQQDWASADATCQRISNLFEFLGKTFGPKGLTDTAFDRLGGTTGGFLKCGLRSRGPYPSATSDDVETLRRWYRANFPEMLVIVERG